MCLYVSFIDKLQFDYICECVKFIGSQSDLIGVIFYLLNSGTQGQI